MSHWSPDLKQDLKPDLKQDLKTDLKQDSLTMGSLTPLGSITFSDGTGSCINSSVILNPEGSVASSWEGVREIKTHSDIWAPLGNHHIYFLKSLQGLINKRTTFCSCTLC